MTVRSSGGTRRPAQRHKSGLKCNLEEKRVFDVGKLLRGACASRHSLLGAIFVLPWKTFIQHLYPPWQHPINPPLPFISTHLRPPPSYWRRSSLRLWPTCSLKSSELNCVFCYFGRITLGSGTFMFYQDTAFYFFFQKILLLWSIYPQRKGKCQFIWMILF